MLAIFPGIQSLVREADYERLAIVIRSRYLGDLGAMPMVSMENLLESVGFKIHQMTHSGLGSILVKDAKGIFRATAVVNPGLDAMGKRFILAVLLGHYLFTMEPTIARGEFDGKGYTIDTLKELINSETIAGGASGQPSLLFAAALLMPQAMFLRASARFKNNQQVAEFFGVPEDLVALRKTCLVPSGQPSVDIKDTPTELSPPGLKRLRQIAKVMDDSVEI
jgi:hypothetical protein